MKNWLNDLSIVSITYNNNHELERTIDSIIPLLELGTSLIIINGGNKISLSKFQKFKNSITIIEENDKGRYDAINKGIELVNSDFFMLIHSGDIFISSPKILNEIINELHKTSSKISLGNQFIDFQGFRRKHKIKFWHPFMLNLGAQPPHLPIIYNSEFAKNQKKYSLDFEIISDHIYLSNLFSKKPKYIKSNTYLISMNGGGATSSGIKSFFRVSREFIQYYGIIRGLFITIVRVPFKFIQMI